VYQIGSVVAGKLHRIRRRTVTARNGTRACVVPFGLCERIETVVNGIHPDLLAISSGLRPYVAEHHSQPFVASIAGLSRAQLARMAETLVTLSAIEGPVRVASLANERPRRLR
jgi:hypothetical protein